MDIDPYSPCPGGTGKKLKFCCTDLMADLDKLSRMIAGDQRAAALDLVEKLDEKYPDRPCLLASKTMLEAELGQPEKATATVTRFREKFPENPVALAETAILQARQDPHGSVVLLQQAIDHMNEQQVPLQVYDALGGVALALLGEGQIVAARAHWMLQFGWSGGKDEETLRFVVQVQSSPEVHLLLKENWAPSEAPADALWKRSFDDSLQKARHGHWLTAANEFEALAAKAGAWPPIQQNIAVLRSWLAENAAAVAAWRTFAQSSGVPVDDASEAEGLAQLLDPQSGGQIEIVRIVYPTDDAETVLARLSSHKQVLRMPGDVRELVPEGEPPPKGFFSLLDRPKPASGANLTIDEVPQMLGQLLVFGRQTDRPARVELLVPRSELEESRQLLAQVTEGALHQPETEEVSGHIDATGNSLALKWYLPEDTPPALRRQLVRAGQRRQLLERWPDRPQQLFDGKTPREAAADPKYRARVLGAILVLDLASSTSLDEADYNELRRTLGLPEAGPIDPGQVSVLQVPYARLHRLEVAKLSDQDLLLAFDRAQEVRFIRAMERLGREIVARPSLDKELDKSPIYATLAQVETDLQKAAADLDQARRIAEAGGKSSARYDLIDLALRMQHGDVQEADRLLHHIRDQHLREPGIAQALYTMLSQWGIIRPDGSLAAEPQPTGPGLVVPGAAAEPAGKIWTPGSEPAAPGGGGKKSALWTPGMD